MISAYYDQSGSLVMGPRTGTPMRLVSPAPVLVPPGAQRAPQAPQIYPPQPQQTQQSLYGAQNGNSVGGKCFGSLHWFGPDLSIVFSVLVCPPRSDRLCLSNEHKSLGHLIPVTAQIWRSGARVCVCVCVCV